MNINLVKHDIRPWLKQAKENSFAIPAFNYSDVWEMHAIVEAAEEKQSPVIMATNEQVFRTHSIPYLASAANSVKEQSFVPVFNHLDHSFNIDNCKIAIEHGYSSVMIDKSYLSLEENIEAVNEVVKYASPMGIGVEAEIGRIKGKSVEGVYTGDKYLAEVSSVIEICEHTKVNYLAVGIGTAHGFYKGEPNIHFDRLQEISEAVDIPLVLHGATGVSFKDIQKTIKLGISKVNIGTQLHYTYIQTLKEELQRNPKQMNIIDLMTPV